MQPRQFLIPLKFLQQALGPAQYPKRKNIVGNIQQPRPQQPHKNGALDRQGLLRQFASQIINNNNKIKTTTKAAPPSKHPTLNHNPAEI
uniref:Uncharacterized protein n=1 Tax=Physcomitrium patens TaxID=3218 RepID=A0A2K1IXH3_PHYPA|nr:hypothetical protein PHYPA_023799 [Physcomitrium patens]